MGYGCGCNKCCQTSCCPSSTVCTSAPQVAGTWNLTLSNIVRQATGPDVTCANVVNVTAVLPITLVLTQCACPNDIFVTGIVTTGPTGPTGSPPILPGDQVLGVFRKDSKRCWTLKLVSPTDNTTFDINFVSTYSLGCGTSSCPRKLNFIYTKPVDPSLFDFSGVGAGCGTKV